MPPVLHVDRFRWASELINAMRTTDHCRPTSKIGSVWRLRGRRKWHPINDTHGLPSNRVPGSSFPPAAIVRDANATFVERLLSPRSGPCVSRQSSVGNRVGVLGVSVILCGGALVITREKR